MSNTPSPQDELKPYQLAGVNFLSKKNFALLADDMGLGKSAQAIVATDTVNAKNILVICPSVARVNWRREFNEWSLFSHDFKVCETLKDFSTTRAIVSYEYATENYKRLREIEWDVVICDESHFIKEPDAKRTQAIYGKQGIIRSTKKLWALSGTPAPNNSSELWPMLYTFGTTPLGFDKFVEYYCDTRPTFYGGKRQDNVIGTRKDKIPEIKEMLSRVMLRRLKKDVLKELPPKTFKQISVEGTSLAEMVMSDGGAYKKQAEALEYSLGHVTTLDEMAFVLEKLASSVSTLRRFVGLQKVKSVAQLVRNELEAGAYEKIIIFGIHTDVIAGLHRELADFGAVVVNGKTPPHQRQDNVDRFQKDKNCKVFIGNIKAAGTAITLTAAHQVLFIEESWTPGENAQASDRAHRIGQDQIVSVRMASLADSIDEKVTSVLMRKTKELSAIFDNNTGA